MGGRSILELFFVCGRCGKSAGRPAFQFDNEIAKRRGA